MTKIVNHWIGGKTVEGASGTYGPVTDPATGAVTTKVAFASVDELVARPRQEVHDRVLGELCERRHAAEATALVCKAAISRRTL